MEMDTADTPLLAALEQLAPHDHLCSIYDSPEEHFAVAIPFIRIGLDRGEKCVYIADDGTEPAVRDAMSAEGIDVERAIATHSLVLQQKADAYLRQGSFDPEWMFTFWAQATAQAMSQGFSALRLTGETEWVLRGAPGLERWVEYESRLARMLAQHNCSALCQYNRRLFPPELVLDVIRTHPTVIYRGVVCRNLYYVPPEELLGTDRAAREVERLLTNIREREEIEYTLRQQGNELRQRVRQQEAIAQLGQVALRAGPLPELFGEALHLITSTCSLEFAEVAELSPDQMLLLRAAVGWKEGLVGQAQLPAGRGSQCAFTLLTGAPSVVEDFEGESRFEVDPLIREQGMTSGVTVLIEGAGRPYGTLGMHSRDRRTFTRDDINFLQAAANVLAAAIERERAEAELRGQREQLAALSRRLIDAQETERREIAHELHDEVGQLLTGLLFRIEGHGPAGGNPKDETKGIVNELIDRVRALSVNLRPPMLDELGLLAALTWQIDRFEAQTGIHVRFHHADLDRRFGAQVEITAFRVVQEALTNVARHAGVRQANVDVWASPLVLGARIEDEGRGFDVEAALAARSSGLESMRERSRLAGGRLDIDSEPGKGTRLSLELPVDAPSLRKEDEG